jgi:hypothetical protein
MQNFRFYCLNAIRSQEPNRVSVCFCGSHLKYRHCHKTAFRLLKSIDAEQLINDLHSIYRYQVRVNGLPQFFHSNDAVQAQN